MLLGTNTSRVRSVLCGVFWPLFTQRLGMSSWIPRSHMYDHILNVILSCSRVFYFHDTGLIVIGVIVAESNTLAHTSNIVCSIVTSDSHAPNICSLGWPSLGSHHALRACMLSLYTRYCRHGA